MANSGTLTAAQQTAVKADILANGDLNAIPNTLDGAFAIAALYNLDAVPDYFVWRTTVPIAEVQNAIELDDVADITAADSDRVIKLLDIRSSGIIAERDTDRLAFEDVFSSATGDNSQDALAAIWYRKATRIEKVLALGANPGTEPAIGAGDRDVSATAGPDTLGFEGPISFTEVFNARNS